MSIPSPWPTQKNAETFYGDPVGANGGPNPKWELANLTVVKPPFAVTYCGKTCSGLRVHKKVAASLERVLKNIWIAADMKQQVVDDWGVSIYAGAYCVRPMRGLAVLSMHAYGAAIDFDPLRNTLHNRHPHFTHDHPVTKAFLAEGWVWGGDWNGNGSSADEPRCDGMHFQAARL